MTHSDEVQRLFNAALQRPPDERQAYLTAAALDASVRAEVLSLLDAAERRATPDSSATTDLLDRLRQGLGERYAVERELGRGGMAVVYLAQDLKHHRRVALKALRPELIPALGPERFLREIEIAAQLAHPNILPLHDSGQLPSERERDPALLYYVMPYLEGETLRARLQRERQLPVEEAVTIACQVGEALGYAHSRGLIHRDIKPENILFQAGQAVVSDFGIARAMSQAGGESLTTTGMAVGTLAYMSPEQATGMKDLDARSDLYSLGVVLYEMLAGKVPRGPGPSGDLTHGPATDLRTVRDSVSPVLATTIARALVWDAAERFATAAQFTQALRAAVASHAMPVAVARSRSPWRRVVAALGMIAVVSILAVPALRTWVFGHGSDATGTLRLAVLPFVNLTGDSTQDYFSDGLTEEMITQLGHLAPGRLGVIGGSWAMRYKKSDKSLDQIGRELDVEYVLEGSVRKEGPRVKVATQLVRMKDRIEVWAESYERDLSGIFAVQSAVAQGVAGSLALALLPGERASLANTRSVNPDAYEAYLRGRERNARLTRTDLETALQYYQSALRKDSTFALPFIGMMLAWSGLQQMGFVPPAEAQSHMREALARALALDSSLTNHADVHYRLASMAVWSHWDWATGDAEFRKADALNPNDAEGQASYAHFLYIMKRPAEGWEHIQRALQLDPFDPLVRVFYALMLTRLHRYEEALGQFRQVQAAVPNMPIVLAQIPNLLYWLGRYDEGLAEERAAWTLRNDTAMVQAFDQGVAEGGYRGAMRRVADVLDGRASTSGAGMFRVSGYYIRAGDYEHGIECLERAYAAHDPSMPYISIAPNFDPVRNDPRFQALVKRLKLP